MAQSMDQLPDDAESLKALILAARADTETMAAERARLAEEKDALTAEVDRLTAQN